MVQGRLFTGGSEGTSYLLGGGVINPVLALGNMKIHEETLISLIILRYPNGPPPASGRYPIKAILPVPTWRVTTAKVPHESMLWDAKPIEQLQHSALQVGSPSLQARLTVRLLLPPSGMLATHMMELYTNCGRCQLGIAVGCGWVDHSNFLRPVFLFQLSPRRIWIYIDVPMAQVSNKSASMLVAFRQPTQRAGAWYSPGISTTWGMVMDHGGDTWAMVAMNSKNRMHGMNRMKRMKRVNKL